MNPVLAATSILALAGIASAAPVLTEPRAYFASTTNNVGNGIWSYGDAAYATQMGAVVRYQRTEDAVVKTDSVFMKINTQSPMYIAKDSLHGYLVGIDEVCMIDWASHPAQLGRCSPVLGFGNGSFFTGGLALGRFINVCNGRTVYAIDTQGDSLRIIDSVEESGTLRCQIEGEIIHTLHTAPSGCVYTKRMVNDLSSIQTQFIDSSVLGTRIWAAGQGAGLLALNTHGELERLKWGGLVHGKPVTGLVGLNTRNNVNSASLSDSNIVVTSDSTIYLLRWSNSDEPALAASLTFDAKLYGTPAVAVDGGYVWVRTPTGLLSLVIQDRTSGIEDRGARGPGSSMSTISVHRGGLVFDPSQSGKAAVLSPSGATLATLELKAGVSVSWKSNRTGIHLVRMADKTIPVLIP
ncbi:MAG: hypothetical protein RL173_3232 [Fibrobacterota bacterium]|jgi:hypothetical protein